MRVAQYGFVLLILVAWGCSTPAAPLPYMGNDAISGTDLPRIDDAGGGEWIAEEVEDLEPVPQCKSDGDCEEFDDGNLCNGRWVCFDGECVEEGEPVVCPPYEELCNDFVCQPDSGECLLEPFDNMTECEDGDLCTVDTVCVDGECKAMEVTDCDDANPCTTGTCDGEGGCNYEFNEAQCDDGNACTVGDKCVEGECAAGEEPLDCDDENLCTDDACSSVQGCIHVNNASQCDDGNFCTAGDKCIAGECIPGGTNICLCATDEECLAIDDDLCDGLMECFEGLCEEAPDSEVICLADDLDQCQQTACNPGTGECDVFAAEEGTPCDDGDLCTDNDACVEEECVGDEWDCDDGDLCTVDECDPTNEKDGCSHMPACVDLDLCTEDLCDAGTGDCSYVEVICEDNDLTTVDYCDPGTGVCHHEPIACDDGDPCTLDFLDEGTGECGSSPKCVDQDLCTVDTCDPATGDCTYVLKDCESDEPVTCMVYACDPATGDCFEAPLDCNDENFCTIDDCELATGECVYEDIACSDNNECTTDFCDPLDGCVYVEAVCDDCNELCKVYTCDPGLGFLASNLDCDDGNACTEGDICDIATGECAYATVNCDDSNACTEDSCDPGTGCLNVDVVCAECTDPCKVYTCAPDTGKFASADIDCADANNCTTDYCDPLLGCVNEEKQCTPDDPLPCATYACAPETGDCIVGIVDCDDGNACTSGDICDVFTGECVYTPTECEDNSACTADSCDPDSGCVHEEIDCDDNNACSSDSCDPNAGCMHAFLLCTDMNPCTVDSCDVATGDCVYDPEPMENEPCSDGDECTDPDSCQSGECVSGPDVCLDCTVEQAVTCGSFVQGQIPANQDGVLDDYDCSEHDYPGKELIYEFNAGCSTEITVTVTKVGFEPNTKTVLDLLVLDADEPCDPDECIAASFGPGGNNPVTTLKFQSQAGKKYYIVVEGRDGSAAGFQLSVACTCIGPGLEDCTNEEDDDGDGFVDCLDPDCVLNPVCQPGQQCIPEGYAMCGLNYFGTIQPFFGGMFSSYACSMHNYAGDEIIYSFGSQQCSGSVTATLTTTPVGDQDTPNIDLLIIDGAQGCFGDSCIAAGLMVITAGGTGMASVTFNVDDDGGPYYIMVDGRQGAWGPYSMTIQCDCK